MCFQLRHLLLFMILALPYSGMGQVAHGFELGGNLMDAKVQIDGLDLPSKNAFGPRVGYIGELGLKGGVKMGWGLLFMQKGFKLDGETWAISSFDLPLRIGYSIPLKNERIRLFGDVGGTFEYNFNATAKIDGETVELLIGDEDGDLKRFSNGIEIGAGVSLAQLIGLRISYYLGMTNLVRNSPNSEWKNHYIGFSLQFLFMKN